MITRMKKLQCLVYHREYEEFLEQLRGMGVVHVETGDINKSENAELRERLERVRRIEQVANQLRSLSVSEDISKMIGDTAQGDAQRGRDVVERVEQINERIRELNTTIKIASEQAEALRPWGDFDPHCTDFLSETGRQVRFYVVNNKLINDVWFVENDAIIINRADKTTYFISIDKIDEAANYATASEVVLPKTTLHEADEKIRTAQAELPKLTTELQILSAQSLADVETAAHEEASEAKMQHVQLDTEKAVEDTVRVMTGWLPAEKEQAVEECLKKGSAWYQITMPTPEDNIPTQMRNNKVTRLYEVLTNMYGTPDYDEFDSTPMIAIFFSIFFGFCVGDAGYGLILALFGFPICRFLKNGLQLDINPRLVTVLGVTSTIVGLVLGTAFGVNLTEIVATPDMPLWYPQKWIALLQPYMISGKVPGTSYDWQMVLALGVGIFHLCIAMFVKALVNLVKYGLKTSFIDWAWWVLYVICVGSGLACVTGAISGDECTIVVLSAVGIFTAYDFVRNISISGGGIVKIVLIDCILWPLIMVVIDYYNMVTGLLGDVLSYIRLYALGLAGGMLGGVFNQLAMQVGGGSEQFGWVFMLLILVLGHTLNLAMSCLSAFVHPLRLTFVEYFKNSGYNGKGVAYNPLTK